MQMSKSIQPRKPSKKAHTMRTFSYRLSLAAFALAASATVTQAQAAMPQAATPASGMMMPKANASGGSAEAMDGAMGRMMAEHDRMGMPFEHVEGRIAYLKAELKITDAQLATWNAFADTMRAEATAMKAMHDDMMKNGMPVTMPDRMAAQHKMMSARIKMLERCEASTNAFYAALSEDQRKEFDQMMSSSMGMM